MSNQLATQEFRDFGPLATSIESTDQGSRLYRALNCILRPKSAIKGKLRYFRLWGIGSDITIQTRMRTLPFTGYSGGVGADSLARAANKTIAVRIFNQGKNFLLFYDLVGSKARGLFYMGDDGTYTSGAYDFGSGSPTFEVLAVGLNSSARWYGKRQATMLKLSNNIDNPVCAQLDRGVTPGKWRVAGSNIAPITPVIKTLPPAKTTNSQASLTIPGAKAIRVICDPATEKLWSYVAQSACTANVLTDRIKITTPSYTPTYIPANGDVVMLAGTSPPTGASFGVEYYAVQVSGQNLSISTTPGGAKINLTSTGTDLVIVRLANNRLANGDQVIYNTSGVATPVGLLEKSYFVRDVTSYSFKVCDVAGGAVITFTTSGDKNTEQSIFKMSLIQRSSGIPLTFTVDEQFYVGEASNGIVKVAIVASTYGTAITSSRTGSGTIPDPYIYTLYTGPSPEASSNFEIVKFVAADTLASGILTARSDQDNYDADTGSVPATFLAGGAGNGTSEGLTSQTCSVYLRYFDAGSNRIGYEGISSDQSNVIIIDANTRRDIHITITPTPLAEGGRFGFIRAYFQFGEGSSAIWSHVGTVANTSGTKTITVGSNTEIGGAMSVDQNRPLPFRATSMVKNQIWHGGNVNTPDLLYVSKEAVDDEIAPEGANVSSPYRIALPEQTSATKVTAIETDNFKVHVHTNQGLIMLDPANPDVDRHVPQVSVGAINPASVVQWEKSGTYYIGSDLVTYQFDGARYGKRDVASATKDAQNYILSRVSIESIARNPDRVNAWLDASSQLLWYFAPAAADDSLIGFAYDFINKGITGEFIAPKMYASVEMEPERTESVFCDEDGNLFYTDSRNQKDWSDDLGTFPAFTPRSTGTAPPLEYNGYPYFDYKGVRYYQASEDIFETGFIDLGSGTARKAFQGLQFSTVKGSRGLVEVTFTNKAGRSVTREYGDIGAKGHDQIHKILAQLPGDAIKIKFRIISAEQVPWIIRNMSLLYRPAGQMR